MKVYEGSILTCDAQDHVYQFLVEDGGRIVHVGNELPARYASFPRVRLGSRALIPAFGDSHIHFASFATFHAGLNVADAKSNAEILEMIRKFVPTCEDKMVIAFGASNHSVAEKKFVTRKPKNSKAYDRKNAQDWKKEYSSSAHFAFYRRCKSNLITLRISKAIFLRCYFCRDPLLFHFRCNFNRQ